MFDYTISTDNSPEIFQNICSKIEKAYPNAIKHRILIDVDDTTIQTFTENGKDIDVYDDYDVGAVFVKSEINLEQVIS